MNAKIQEILHKHLKNNKKELEFRFRTIHKSEISAGHLPIVRMTEAGTTHTFDGRALFIGDSCDPIFSVPDETRDIISLERCNTKYIFLLNTKNKLEVCKSTDAGLSERLVLTRNVQSMDVTENFLYYAFQKGNTIYVNTAFFDGEKWIGKRAMPGFTGTHVDLFCSDASAYPVIDGVLYSETNREIARDVGFVHKHKNTLIIGREAYNEDEEPFPRQYEFTIMNILSNLSEEDTLSLDVEGTPVVRADKDIIALQTGKKIMLFQIVDLTLKNVYAYESDVEILAFDLQRGEDVQATLLMNEPAKKQQDSPDKAFLDFEDLKKSVNAKDQEELNDRGASIPVIKETSNAIHESIDDVIFPDNVNIMPPNKPASLLPDKPTASSPDKSTKKNSLLDEVKEQLAERTSPKSFISNAMQAKMKGESRTPKSKKSMSVAVEDINNEMQAALRSALIAVFQKNDVFIKDLVAKVILPPIEAAMNEMRVQVLAEVRKMTTMAELGEGEHLRNFKRLITTGAGKEAARELLKVQDSEFESYLMHLCSDMLDDVDSDTLAELAVRLCGMVQKTQTDILQRSLLDVLAAIDITALSIDRIQALSVALRYCRDTERVNENCPGVCHVAELLTKKIKRHSKKMSSKF